MKHGTFLFVTALSFFPFFLRGASGGQRRLGDRIEVQVLDKDNGKDDALPIISVEGTASTFPPTGNTRAILTVTQFPAVVFLWLNSEVSRSILPSFFIMEQNFP